MRNLSIPARAWVYQQKGIAKARLEKDKPHDAILSR